MTTRNLDALFAPRAIALVGASNQPESLGQVVARNLTTSGFAGPVLMVNPYETAIGSSLNYRSVAELPLTPDLAVVATPAAAVPQVVRDLGARGCRAAVVLGAGFEGPAGAGLRQALLQAARPHLMRLLGPNCLGLISTSSGVNASFSHAMPAQGAVALVSQSGAVAAAAMDWAAGAGVGFSHIVTIGDGLDVDLGDVLDYLANDAATHAVMIYAEGISNGRKFMSAARVAAHTKPVVILKAGRSAEGARAAFSHTGALAGSDLVCDAAFRRAGLLRAADLPEFFAIGAALASGARLEGSRLAVLTNGGGAGVLAADALTSKGGRLAQLAPKTLKALSKSLPEHGSMANPVDILGDATAADYAGALAVLTDAPEVDGILVINCPTALSDGVEIAEKVVLVSDRPAGSKPVLTCWLRGASPDPGREILSAAGLPIYAEPETAVGAFMALARHRETRSLLFQAAAADPAPAGVGRADQLLAAVAGEDRTVLTDPEARLLLAAYGIPVIESLTAADPASAARLAARFKGPVALKILSKDISHKSDAGGVELELSGASSVRAAAVAMLKKLERSHPQARIEGFTVEPMVRRELGEELLVGISQDPVFGPIILFGQGGLAVEVAADRCAGLPPLDEVLALEMIGHTQVSRRLAGFRTRPAADMAALTKVIMAVARLAVDHPEVAELDINPLIASPEGVLALDARVVLQPAYAAVRPAILPYPADMVRKLTIGGRRLTLRPVRPADAPAICAMVEACTPEDIKERFGGAIATFPLVLAARLAHLDYDRQMGLAPEGRAGDLNGFAHLMADPEFDTAELTLLVRSDRQNRRLGREMLQALLDHAQTKGLRQVWMEVGNDNGRMLTLGRALGFTVQASGDPKSLRLVRELRSESEPKCAPHVSQPGCGRAARAV